MNDYIIITDSTSDLPEYLVKELGIKVMPMKYIIDGDNYCDENVMPITDFYKMMRNKKRLTTSSINVATFIEEFENQVKNGKDVIYISLSSGISGNYSAAKIAAQEIMERHKGSKVFAVDSLCASLGEGLLVYYAAEKKKEGLSIESLRDWLDANKLNVCHWFTVDDLFHLKRGGRVSSASAVFGTMLNVKPVLHVDNNGKLIPVEKVRGRKAALLALAERMEKLVDFSKGKAVFISHGDSKEDADFLAETVKEKVGVNDILINYIGPTIGTHSGPGTIALFFMGKER